MARCVICGNTYDYDRSFQVIRSDRAYAFDSLECTIHFLRRCSSAWAEKEARRRRVLMPLPAPPAEKARGATIRQLERPARARLRRKI